MTTKTEKEEFGVVIPSPAKGEQVVVKFKKEGGIRYTGTEFASVSRADVSSLQEFLKKHSDIKVERMFEQTEETLDREVKALTSEFKGDLPALSGYYNLMAKDSKQAETICVELEKHPLVDEVYIEPRALPAIFDRPAEKLSDEALPATPDFSSLQGYLNPATEGVDAYYAWTLPGGKGDKVQVIDIEGAWNFSHEDLLQNQGGVVGGTPTSDLGWENHGTAVAGEISGDENPFGILGIAPEAKIMAISIFGNSTAKAIKTAADKLNKGDIILIELHRPGPKATGSGQYGYIALEWWSADFDAIKYATAKGIIVIEAAGNGYQDLDDPAYEGRFDRGNRDSGAILVGAGAPPNGYYGPDRSRLDFSNYGSIVDAQGWGRDVTTTGYGNLQGGSDKNKWYTKYFNGTSSASPIVVGATACLQSIYETRMQTTLTYIQIREILRQTGSPQTDAPDRPRSQRIGNRPDLKTAIAYVLPQVSSGIATRYWNECLPYPPGNPAKLWLYVNHSWKYLDNPTQGIRDMVQRAFLGSGSQVRVWYDNSTIIGLSVESA